MIPGGFKFAGLMVAKQGIAFYALQNVKSGEFSLYFLILKGSTSSPDLFDTITKLDNMQLVC